MLNDGCSHVRCILKRCPGSASWCILHDPNPEKDGDMFKNTVDEKIKHEEEDG